MMSWPSPATALDCTAAGLNVGWHTTGARAARPWTAANNSGKMKSKARRRKGRSFDISFQHVLVGGVQLFPTNLCSKNRVARQVDGPRLAACARYRRRAGDGGLLNSAQENEGWGHAGPRKQPHIADLFLTVLKCRHEGCVYWLSSSVSCTCPLEISEV